MDSPTTRITIEPAQNGYMVYINDFPTGLSVKNVPYVFETMGHLFKFLETQLENKQ